MEPEPSHAVVPPRSNLDSVSAIESKQLLALERATAGQPDIRDSIERTGHSYRSRGYPGHAAHDSIVREKLTGSSSTFKKFSLKENGLINEELESANSSTWSSSSLHNATTDQHLLTKLQTALRRSRSSCFSALPFTSRPHGRQPLWKSTKTSELACVCVCCVCNARTET